MSTVTGWRYAINTFEVNTKGSNVKMLTLSTDTYAKLKNEEGNPAIAAILLVYEPVFFAYRDICELYSMKTGDYRGSTVGFKQKMKDLPAELRVWEGAIRAVHTEDSPEEVEIFPNKRTPFETGTYEKRLEALGALKQKVAADPALAAVSPLISSFYNTAMSARLVQQTREGAVDEISDLREDQRILLAQEMMSVIGGVIVLHKAALNHIERYFDLSLLYDRTDEEAEEATGTIGPNAIVTVADYNSDDFDFTGSTVVRITNTSGNGANIVAYPSNAEGSMPGSGTQYLINDGQFIEKTFSELGSESFLFLLMQNLHTQEASWKIEIL